VPVVEPLVDLFEKPVNELIGGIIVNAGARRSEQERNSKLQNLKNDLETMGLSHNDTIDLLRYKSPQEMFAALKKYDYLYAAGGNSFDLVSAIHTSGFDDVLPKLLSMNKVYIGESAGAVVCGPSLRGFDVMDENKLTKAKDMYKGLGLIDMIIVPHNDSPDPRFKGRSKHIKVQNPEYVVKPLNDNQAVVINGKQVTAIEG
jgi:dipeptidase E